MMMSEVYDLYDELSLVRSVIGQYANRKGAEKRMKDMYRMVDKRCVKLMGIMNEYDDYVESLADMEAERR
jgi:hypothetical protein